MFSRRFQLVLFADAEVELLEARCYNGVVRVGSVVVYHGQEYTVKSLSFDRLRKKSFIEMSAVEDGDITVRLPALTATAQNPAHDIYEFIDY